MLADRAALTGAAHSPMKTVVYQSYRTHDVPRWVTRCMQSVTQWARVQQFEYRFIDDRLFDYVPPWYRQAAGANIQVITNLARLAVARELLAEGYERTIWVDADIVVFDTSAFRVEITHDFAFCYEVWLTLEAGETHKQSAVNNSVSVFVRGNAFLDFCIWAHEDLVRRGTQILAHGTSTRLLSALYTTVPFPLLTNVGMLSPAVAQDMRDGSVRLAQEYAALHARPIHAINLCGSMCGKLLDGRVLDDGDYDMLVGAMLASRGTMFRREVVTPGVSPG